MASNTHQPAAGRLFLGVAMAILWGPTLHAADPLPKPIAAVLLGHAILDAGTFVAAPPDAPADARVSGKFTGTGNLRNSVVGSTPTRTADSPPGRATGLSLPFDGQPVQGVSGVVAIGDGSYWALSDNGFGSKRNSPDALLAIHRLRPDFAHGSVTREHTLWIRDPRQRIDFRITHEGTPERYLTGADLDPESIQMVPDGFWIGDEFGPFLVKLDRKGVVECIVEAQLDGRTLRSPDHPQLQLGASPSERVAFEVARSGGFESLALGRDGRHLYAMLEKPLYGVAGVAEGRFLRVLEFDLRRKTWSGRSMRYALGDGATAVGELQMIDGDRALLIERDGGEGDAGLACGAQRLPPDCFATPAGQRRNVMVAFDPGAADPNLQKLGAIDLLAIADPQSRARRHGDRGPSARGRFAMPFATIESVLLIAPGRILVVNDNNLPFSAGRFLARADDTEFVLLRVSGL
jgi:hypothetical protein